MIALYSIGRLATSGILEGGRSIIDVRKFVFAHTERVHVLIEPAGSDGLAVPAGGARQLRYRDFEKEQVIVAIK